MLGLCVCLPPHLCCVLLCRGLVGLACAEFLLLLLLLALTWSLRGRLQVCVGAGGHPCGTLLLPLLQIGLTGLPTTLLRGLPTPLKVHMCLHC